MLKKWRVETVSHENKKGLLVNVHSVPCWMPVGYLIVCNFLLDILTVEWRKLHNEGLNDLYCSPKIVRVIKSRIMRWAEHLARMGRREGCTGSWWGNLVFIFSISIFGRLCFSCWATEPNECYRRSKAAPLNDGPLFYPEALRSPCHSSRTCT